MDARDLLHSNEMKASVSYRGNKSVIRAYSLQDLVFTTCREYTSGLTLHFSAASSPRQGKLAQKRDEQAKWLKPSDGNVERKRQRERV